MTIFRVPLVLEYSLAVIRRLNPRATRQAVPHSDVTAGYNELFREPEVYGERDATTGAVERSDSRTEKPAIKVPCQFETLTHEELRQLPAGADPDTRMILVFHRMNLTEMNLINKFGELEIKVNDRVTHLESSREPGKVTLPFAEPGYYINMIMPDSAGFGPDGYDLYLAYLTERQRGVRG